MSGLKGQTLSVPGLSLLSCAVGHGCSPWPSLAVGLAGNRQWKKQQMQLFAGPRAPSRQRSPAEHHVAVACGLGWALGRLNLLCQVSLMNLPLGSCQG